jgi:hypothetical protein
MNFMDVHRPRAPAIRTVAAKNFLGLSLDRIGRDLLGNAQTMGALMAAGVAKPVLAVPDAAEKNCCSAVRALGHDYLRFEIAVTRKC